MTVEDVAKLREAWRAVQAKTATDEQWLLLVDQPGPVLDRLKETEGPLQPRALVESDGE